jgi:protein TonB
MPSPDFNLNEYLEHNLHYPEAARMANIQGRVLLSFIINEDGSISGVQVVRGIGGECDQEALRVIASMPRWKPGMQNGSPVKVVFTLPVLFTLD